MSKRTKEQALEEYLVALHEQNEISGKMKEISEKVQSLHRELTEEPASVGNDRQQRMASQNDNPFARWRKDQEITQAEAAEKCDVSGGAFSMWERGVSTPTDESIAKLPRGLRGTVRDWVATLVVSG